MRKLLVIVGATGVGKSALAVELALRLRSGQAKQRHGIRGAEIVSADSRQVYRGLDIGTGKVTQREMRGIPHHMLDVASLRRTYTVTRYQRDALRAIRGIWRRGKLPILCGGTGLYVRAVVDGVVFPEVPPNRKLRARLEKKSMGELYRMLRLKDPRRAKEIDRHNPRRLIRALEIIAARGNVPMPKKNPLNAHVLMVGLRMPKQKLEKRTRARIRSWLQCGLLREVESVPRARLRELGIVYQWAARLMYKEITRPVFIEGLTRDLMQYAKRQEQWWKHDPRVIWLS